MSFLTINGVEVKCDRATPPTLGRVNVGEYSRSYAGAPRTTVRTVKRELRARTPRLQLAEAACIQALLAGEGHVLSFERTADNPTGLATSRGLTPTGTVEATSIQSSSGFPARYGDFYVVLGAAVGLSYDLGADYVEAWTVMAWRRVGGTWKHHVLTGDANDYRDYWENGVYDEGEAGWASMGQGVLTLISTDAGSDIDDVVVLPFIVPSEWVPGLYAFHSSRAFPALPLVGLGGDYVAAGLLPATALCELGEGVPSYQVGPGGVQQPRLSFDFTLRGT